MFEKINNFVAEMRLNEANAKLNGLSSRYGVAQAAGAGASVAPQPRGRSLNQEDTVFLAGKVEYEIAKDKRLSREQFIDSICSGELVSKIGTCVAACGVAAAAGAVLAAFVPTISAPLLAFGFAVGAYSMGAFIGGQGPGHIRMPIAAAGMGLVAGALNFIPGGGAFIVGGAMFAAGIAAGIYGVNTRSL